MARYEKYKDSGLDWLGTIPEHWQLRRANYIMRPIDVRSKTGEETLLSVSEHHGVKLRSESNVTMFMAASYVGYKLCEPHDLVINSLWAWSRGLAFSEYAGIVSTAYSVFRLNNEEEYNYRFLNYLLRTDNYVAQYLILSKGIWISRLQLSDWNFLRIPILLPSKPEQDAIVSYLDSACGEIDKAIAQQQRMIDLLNERKAIVIENAVTKGIDGRSHTWESRRLRHVCEFRNGYTPSKDIPAYWENGTIPWYRMDDIREYGRKLSVSNQYITPLAVKGGGLFEAGSFILATTATVGEHALLIADSLANQQFTNLKIRKSLRKNLLTDFFFYYLYRIDRICKSISNTSTFPAVNMQELKNISVLIPPIDEQKKIVAFLDERLEQIDSSIERVNRQIDLLKERKRIIINDVVTGKIKVS